MKKMLLLAVLSVVVLVGCVERKDKAQSSAQFRRISVAEYLDKMKGGWVGQMAGVGWGGPTEFRHRGHIIEDGCCEMPKWKPELINQFRQDDIYVEMTFIRTLEQYGFDVDIRQAGIDFANSGYNLWHANRYGRENLRKGIAPPDSSHPLLRRIRVTQNLPIMPTISTIRSKLTIPGLSHRGCRTLLSN